MELRPTISLAFAAGVSLLMAGCITPPEAVPCQCTPQLVQTETTPWDIKMDGGVETGAAREITVSAASLPARRARLDLDHAVTQVNDVRTARGLRALRLSDPLMQAARAHAADMARVDRVSHKGSDGASLAKRLQRAGYDPLLAEENLSGGQRDFDEALSAWLQSPDHQRRLMNPDVTEMGVAVRYDPATRYRTFWALILADPF